MSEAPNDHPSGTPQATERTPAAVLPEESTSSIREDAAEAADVAERAASLESVVDDLLPEREPAVEWAAEELLRERPFDEVIADLTNRGWPPEQADAIVEEAREATRRERGVRTREDVLRSAEQRYQRSLRFIRLMIIVAIAVVFIILVRFFG